MERLFMMTAKVSVVIPAYNGEKYIAEAIESALTQSYPVFEIIVVDDGSADRTKEIVGQYPQIKYFYQENKGPAAARNKGIRESSGEYIAFLDSDDAWAPKKTELQVEKMEGSPEHGLVYTGRTRVGPHRAKDMKKRLKPPEGYVFERLLKNNFICCSSVMVRRECFRKAGYFDESSAINKSEDYDMWLRIARDHSMGFIDMPLVYYRINLNGHCRSSITAAYAAREQVILKSLRYFNGDREKLKKEIIKKMRFDMGRSLLNEGDYKTSKAAFIEAAKMDITDFRPVLFYMAAKYKEIKESLICQSA